MNFLILIHLILFSVSVAFGAVEAADVDFGFNDRYKTGTWVPLRITVQSQDQPTRFIGDLVVDVRSFSSDTPIERYASELDFRTTEEEEKNFYVYCPKNAVQLVVQLVPTTSSKSTVSGHRQPSVIREVSLPTPLSRKDSLVLALAQSGDKLKRFIDKQQLVSGSDGARIYVEYLQNATLLPRDWIGYSAVDVLVIRKTVLPERRISKAQRIALLDWVQRGGTLILSGGNNFNALQDSFVEPFLPVELKSLKKTDRLPDTVREQLGFQAQDNKKNPVFEYIQFSPKAGCETLIGTAEQIYVAKRKFGDGQIICLAFDYNAPPFSEQQVGERFWHGLLSRHGKSARHFTDQYALALQHEEKIHKEFLRKGWVTQPLLKTGLMRVPLVKLLFIVLPIYLLSFGGFLFYFGKSKQKGRIYWVGGCVLVLLSVSTIAVARNVLPNSVKANRLSILSVYPERQRAHLLSYVSVRATARAEISTDYKKGSFMRHQEVEASEIEHRQTIGTLFQGSEVQLREMLVDPWYPTTYVKEIFFDLTENARTSLNIGNRVLGQSELPRILENVWRVTGREMTYLGEIALDAEPEVSSTGWVTRPVLQITPKIPPAEGLSGNREWFARILRQEYVLRHLDEEANVNLPPYMIGWTSQGFTDMAVDGNVRTDDETLVIFRPALTARNN